MSDKYELIRTERVIDELTNPTPLYRIRALKDFSDVKKGDVGGFVQGTHNLRQFNNCWVYDDAVVCGMSNVSGDAQIRQNAYVEGDSWPHYNCVITGNAVVRDSRISDNVWVTGDAIVVKCGLHPILY